MPERFTDDGLVVILDHYLSITGTSARQSLFAYARTPQALRRSSRQTDIADAAAAISGIAKGQGFSQRLTAADRKAIELHAMRLATAHYEARGFDVTDVSMNQPYDLRCTTGAARLDVEVKGTTTSGEVVLLTPNEVSHALTHFPDTTLVVVREITLEGRGTTDPKASAGVLEAHEPWRPLDTALKPLGYSYAVPKAS